MAEEPAVLAIIGPTATGKSALALELARVLPAEIISMDSAMVYRGMDIGTAKPSAAERAAVPHHLIDICSPDAAYSAEGFRRDCIRLVCEIRARRRLPVICGGTMLYYRALLEGLAPVPEVSAEVREHVRTELAAHGVRALHARLAGLDPRAYAQLSAQDTQRVCRALEVCYATGRPLSYFQDLPREPCPFAVHEICLMPRTDRADVRPLFRLRFERMLAAGLLGEVRALVQRHALTAAHAALRCVGYRQVYEHLCGAYAYPEMIERAVAATARLAKHQMTWLRGGLRLAPRRRCLLPPGGEGNLQRLLEELRCGGTGLHLDIPNVVMH